MKHLLLILFFFFFFLSSHKIQAQTVSSNIIDAVIQYDSASTHYKLYVFLTDTLGFSGLNISIGSHSDSSDLKASGSLNKSGVAIQAGSTVVYDLSGFSPPSSYYIKAEVLLSNSTENVISKHATN